MLILSKNPSKLAFSCSFVKMERQCELCSGSSNIQSQAGCAIGYSGMTLSMESCVSLCVYVKGVGLGVCVQLCMCECFYRYMCGEKGVKNRGFEGLGFGYIVGE